MNSYKEYSIDELLISMGWVIQDDRRIGFYKNIKKYGYYLKYEDGFLSIEKFDFINTTDYASGKNFSFKGYVSIIEMKLILKIFEKQVNENN